MYIVQRPSSWRENRKFRPDFTNMHGLCMRNLELIERVGERNPIRVRSTTENHFVIYYYFHGNSNHAMRTSSQLFNVQPPTLHRHPPVLQPI